MEVSGGCQQKGEVQTVVRENGVGKASDTDSSLSLRVLLYKMDFKLYFIIYFLLLKLPKIRENRENPKHPDFK